MCGTDSGVSDVLCDAVSAVWCCVVHVHVPGLLPAAIFPET